jgi:aryl-alcohol dehydrogenase-like predicted oxidoreductase
MGCVRKKFGKLPRQVPRGYLKKLTKRVIENFDQINSMLAQGFSMFELAEMYGTTASRFYGAVCRARKQFESGATSIENILKLSRAPK